MVIIYEKCYGLFRLYPLLTVNYCYSKLFKGKCLVTMSPWYLISDRIVFIVWWAFISSKHFFKCSLKYIFWHSVHLFACFSFCFPPRDIITHETVMLRYLCEMFICYYCGIWHLWEWNWIPCQVIQNFRDFIPDHFGFFFQI